MSITLNVVQLSKLISQPKPINQRGATLIMALVMLLIMSVIAISNMQTSTLQERMAGNTRQKSVSKYAAESALKIAEQWLEASVTGRAKMKIFDGNNGLYSAVSVTPFMATYPSADDIAYLNNAKNWQDISAYKGTTDIIDPEIVSRQPQYIIEYIGRDFRGSGNQVIATDDLSNSSFNDFTRPFYFRITAVGWGKDERIYTVLESTYKTGSADYFNY